MIRLLLFTGLIFLFSCSATHLPLRDRNVIYQQEVAGQPIPIKSYWHHVKQFKDNEPGYRGNKEIIVLVIIGVIVLVFLLK